MNDTTAASTPKAASATSTTATRAAPAGTPTPATTPGSPAPSTPFAPITEGEIAAFADKLAQSGADLPPAQQMLLQVIVDRARAIRPEDVRAVELQQELTKAVTAVAAAQAQAWNTDDGPGWARIDPIWYKAGDSDTGGTFQMSIGIGAPKAEAP